MPQSVRDAVSGVGGREKIVDCSDELHTSITHALLAKGQEFSTSV